MLSLQENVSIYSQGLDDPDAGHRARRQAIQLFWRVYSQGVLRRLWNCLVRSESHLRELSDALQGMKIKSRHGVGLQHVSIANIRGSEGRCQDFDAAFCPVHNRTEERWVSIAIAQKVEVTLPPVDLIQLGDEYYVRDGHHRISVAKSLGQMEIEAQVTVWEV